MSEIIKNIKNKAAAQKVSGLVKEVNKDVKNIKKLKQDYKVADTKEEKDKIKTYIETLEEKVGFVLSAMTRDKVDAANLAQLSKALRILSDNVVRTQGGDVKSIEEKKLNININVKDMSPEQLLEFLGKKSQEYRNE